MSRETAFVSEVGRSLCPCHFGKFHVLVALIIPGQGKLPVEMKHFDTQKEAEDNLVPLTEQVVEKELAKIGKTLDSADRVMRAHGDEASELERKFHLNNSEDLH